MLPISGLPTNRLYAGISILGAVLFATVLMGCPYASPVPMGTERLPIDKKLMGRWIPTDSDATEAADTLGKIYVEVIQRNSTELQFAYRGATTDLRTISSLNDLDLKTELFLTAVNGSPILNEYRKAKYYFYRYEVDDRFLRRWSVVKKHFTDSENETITFNSADALKHYAAQRLNRDGFFSSSFDLFIRDNGNVSADDVFARGKVEYDAENYREALQWMRASANLGHRDAQNYAGYMYHKGQGTRADTSKAIAYYTKAARQDHHGAQVSLGSILYEGHHVYEGGKRILKTDPYAAVRWWRRAAVDNRLARYNMGVAYYNGRGVPRDHSRARTHFTEAYRAGYAPAKDMLDRIERPQPR